jgi:cytochrome c553
LPVSYNHVDLVYTPHPATVTCVACHATGTEQVLWKFPNLKPGCGGCHGPLFNTGGVRRSKGPAQSLPRVP